MLFGVIDLIETVTLFARFSQWKVFEWAQKLRSKLKTFLVTEKQYLARKF